MWINIGNQNPTTELCKDHSELGKGRNPEWGTDIGQLVQLSSGAWQRRGYDFKVSIYCCWPNDVPTFEDPPPTPTQAPTASKPSTAPTAAPTQAPTTYVSKWHFAPLGHARCDYGSPATQNECEAAVKALASDLGRNHAKGLAVGNSSGNCKSSGWNAVPRGCSAQTGGSWVAHYKTSGDYCNGGTYQVVCG